MFAPGMLRELRPMQPRLLLLLLALASAAAVPVRPSLHGLGPLLPAIARSRRRGPAPLATAQASRAPAVSAKLEVLDTAAQLAVSVATSQLTQEMRLKAMHDRPLNEEEYASLISLAGAADNWQLAVQLVTPRRPRTPDQRDPGRPAAHTCAPCLGQLREMDDHGVTLSAPAHLATLWACARAAQWRVALELTLTLALALALASDSTPTLTHQARRPGAPGGDGALWPAQHGQRLHSGQQRVPQHAQQSPPLGSAPLGSAPPWQGVPLGSATSAAPPRQRHGLAPAWLARARLLGSAPFGSALFKATTRLLRLLGARLAALGGPALPGGAVASKVAYCTACVLLSLPRLPRRCRAAGEWAAAVALLQRARARGVNCDGFLCVHLI